MNSIFNKELIFVVCRRWLEFVALMHVILGILIFFMVPSNLITAYIDSLLTSFNVIECTNETCRELVYFLVRLFGPTIASWGILMWYLVRRALLKKDTTASNMLIAAVLIWFVLDTTLSMVSGILIHGVVNMVAFLSIVVPLMVSRYLNKDRAA